MFGPETCGKGNVCRYGGRILCGDLTDLLRTELPGLQGEGTEKGRGL